MYIDEENNYKTETHYLKYNRCEINCQFYKILLKLNNCMTNVKLERIGTENLKLQTVYNMCYSTVSIYRISSVQSIRQSTRDEVCVRERELVIVCAGLFLPPLESK